jgi:uncharacterized protein (DUF4415 family)
MDSKLPPPPEDYDDNPEWTEEDFARARPASEVFGRSLAVQMGLVRKPGRPALDPEARKQKINIRLSPDVLEALRASGPGWQSRVDEMLRERLGLGAGA